MLTEAEARHIAGDWIAAWNAHDLDRILEHYAHDVEFVSPFAVRLLGDPTGTIRGKEALRAYFGRALESYPELTFELFHVLCGVNSLTLYYRSVKNLLAAEVMEFDPTGKVRRVLAHYTTG